MTDTDATPFKTMPKWPDDIRVEVGDSKVYVTFETGDETQTFILTLESARSIAEGLQEAIGYTGKSGRIN